MQRDQQQSDVAVLARQLPIDISQAEQVLLRHLESVSQPSALDGLKQQAHSLFFQLQQQAEQQQAADNTADSTNAASTSANELEAHLQASHTVLLSVVNSNLLAELCAVLLSLYTRKANLHACSAQDASNGVRLTHHIPDSLPSAEKHEVLANAMPSSVKSFDKDATAHSEPFERSVCQALQPAAPPVLPAAEDRSPERGHQQQQDDENESHIAALR